MIYKIAVYRTADSMRAVTECSFDTKADMADGLNLLYRTYPRADGFYFEVSAEQTTRYVLVDSQLLADGDSTADRLWDFFLSSSSRRNSR